MLSIHYNNKTRKEALHHARLMAASSYELGKTFYSYKHQRDNNEETAYLGKIAEILFNNWLLDKNVKITNGPLSDLAYSDPSSNYDGDFTINNQKIELKTKTCNCEPQLSYDVGSTRISKADIYVFSRIWEGAGVFYLVGWLPTNKLKDIATFRTKGSTVINSSESEFSCLSNEYVTTIDKLNNIDLLIKELKYS